MKKRTLRVTGKGKLSLTPDTVQLLMHLNDTDPDYGKVVKDSTEHAQSLKEALMTLDFEASDLKTTSFQVNAEYESYRDENDNWKERFVGYRAMHTLKLSFPRDKDRLGKVLFLVAGHASKPEFHLEYTVADPEKAKNELLANAVADSRIKADVLAKAADVTLGEILSIDYSWGEIDLVTRPVMLRETNGIQALAKSAAMEDSLNLDIEPDDIKVEDTVTVIWELE